MATSTRRTRQQSDQETDVLEAAQPLVRVFLLGSFRVEWQVPYGGQADAWNHRTSARALFKLLLLAPQRQATRLQLASILWPESDESKALGSLRSAMKALRQVLHPADGQDILHVSDDGKVLRLPAQDLLWTDIDAFEEQVIQARALSSLQDAATFWEQACSLLCGELFADEIGEWLDHRWVKARFTRLLTARRHLIHALGDLYLQRGQHAEAQEMLQDYVSQFPTDQDALCLLLRTLMMQQRYVEARACYDRNRAILTQRGESLALPLKALGKQIRHLSLQRVHMIVDASASAMHPQYGEGMLFSSPVSQDTIEGTGETEGTMMNQLRRQFLEQALKGFGGAFLAPHNRALSSVSETYFSGQQHLFHHEEIHAIYAAHIPLYWRMYFDGHNRTLQGVLSECLSSLAPLTAHPSPFQKQAAIPASKASQLACMLALQEQNFGQAFFYAQQGFEYGQLADDPHLQVASLIRKALVYFYLRYPRQKLHTYQEALRYEKLVSPLLRARIFAGLSEAHGNLLALGEKQQEQPARTFLDLSYQTLPSSPQEDPHFSYTHFGSPVGYESLLYLDLKQPHKAWDLLVNQNEKTSQAIVPDRVTLLIRQTKTLLALEKMEECCTYLALSIRASKVLNSPLYLEEIHDVSRQVLARWPQEQQVKDLTAAFLPL